ncbi:reverse transcriptase, partial [Hamiltosporidium tvaerminnensis]
KKQEIYEKHLQEIKKQTEIEESKKHIKIRIKEYEIQRNNLIEEKYKLDSDNFNSIIEAVKKIPISHQTFTMPISLISLLNQVQVNLPKNYQDIDRCIEELFKKKEEFEKKIEPNMLRLNKQIQEIDEKIKEEYKVLEGMPPTEVKVYKEKKIVVEGVSSKDKIKVGLFLYFITFYFYLYNKTMGRRKKVDSENIKNEEIKVVNNSEISLKETKTCDRDVVTISETLPPQPTILNLLDSTPHSSGPDSSASIEQEWPISTMSAVQKRFERMPRNGWFAILRYYNGKFGRTFNIDVVKKLTHNEAEREIRQEENGERRKFATCLAEPCIEKFLCKIKELSEKEIENVVVRTRKLPSELVESKVLELINQITGKYAESHVPKNVSDAARIIQAAQKGYDEETRKEKPRSAWKENIESKISKLVLFKDLLEKARKQEKLSTSETKSLKKIMREFNLNLSSVTDLSEALKKITMHESRKQFRKENRMFEFFQRRFYRGLSERVESEHVVNRDEIVNNHSTTFPSLDELVNIINWLLNWIAAGIDDIYNFFIKKLTTLHKYLYDIVKVICSDYRPITCMSNLYKLTTKCVTKVVQIEVERRGYLAENQLGAVRGVQGAKEQALLNIALNKEYGNNLKVTWIDVKKAYDLIDHAYLTQCIDNFNLPDWILKFISRKLNEKYTKVTLLAKDSSTLSAMTGEEKEFLEVIGLEINKEKSATNDTCCEDTATLLEGVSVYKYLGIIEDSRGIPTRSSFEEVQSKPISRVERLCHTRLNAKNLFSAINQHAISSINYHIGVLRLEPADFSKLDDAVRAVLVKNKIHLRPGCKERLYLPRTELGRGLHSVELRSEHMLLQLLDCLEKTTIFKVENNNKTHLALIKGFLKVKYRLVEEVTKKSLEETQLAKLYNEIEKR